MNQVCIITDSTAQFPTPIFAGRQLINVIPLHIKFNGDMEKDEKDLKTIDLPTTTRIGLIPQVSAPSVHEFEEAFTRIGQRYKDMIAILHSSYLSKTVMHAKIASKNIEGKLNIQVVDAQTTAIGLGLLVQEAAAASEQDLPINEIERVIRSLIPRIYSVFCIEGLTYLQHSGYLGAAQALIGEYLKVIPLFILENGMLVPTQKARNYRHLVDLLHEFICEFTELRHIALLQSVPPFEVESRSLRERVTVDFPDTPLSEHTIGSTLATMIGPRSLGLFVLQP
jgi:DegV family protein with EDD domain